MSCVDVDLEAGARQPGPVLLCTDVENSRDADENETPFYFCVKIPRSLVTNSEVIAGLPAGPGFAKLPIGITDDDFLRWFHQGPGRAPDATADLVTFLRVADMLSDKRMRQWTRLLGTRIANTDWSAAAPAEEMLEQLLRLPANPLNAALQHMLAFKPPDQALTTLPPALHSSIIGAMITADGTLRHCPPRASNSGVAAAAILMAHLPQLPRVTSCHPPIKELMLDTFPLQPSSAQSLLHAAAVHTAISSLSLCMPEEESATLTILDALLPALPVALHLRNLYLCTPSTNAHSIGPQALQCIANALPTLSSLQRLSIASGSDIQDGKSLLRRPGREWSRACAAFLYAVAAHTGLTALHMDSGGISAPLPWPEEFPRLRDLSVTVMPVQATNDSLSRARVAAAFPSLPELTRLSFDFTTCVSSGDEPLAHWFPLPPGSNMSHGLRSLVVGVNTAPWRFVADAEYVWEEFRDAIGACTSLEHLRIVCTRTAAMAPLILPLLTQMHGLTSLELAGVECDDPGDETQSAWESFVEALSALSNLREFQLGPHPDRDSALLMQVLRTLWKSTSLTQLHLDWGRQCQESPHDARLHGAVAAEGLRGLTHLRELRLAGFVPVDEADLWAGVAALPRLELLAVDQHNNVLAHQLDGECLIDAVTRMTHLTCLDIGDTGISLDLESLAHALLDRPVSRPRPLVILYGLDQGTSHQSLIAQLAEQNVEFRVDRLW